VEVKKDGYHPWQKSLNVIEKQVTEAKYLTLIPQNVPFNRIVENISRFWLSPDGKSLFCLKTIPTGGN